MSIYKKLTAWLLMLALLAFGAESAFAHEIPDATQTGTITLTMKLGDQLVTDGSIALYRVGDVTEEDGNYFFALNDTFQASGVTLTSEEDLESEEIAATLADYAVSQKAESTVASVTEEGNVTFTELELGLYLVTQQDASTGYTDITPFLVSIPQQVSGEYLYTVDASPKVELEEQAIPPEPSPTPTPTGTTQTVTASKLPQTGQLNWPVPVLAAAGLVLFALGWSVYSRRKDGTHEG